MANTKIIKQKIKAITSIKKITKTMEMVAVSKMKKTVTDVTNLAEYIREIKFVINKVKSESGEGHRYFGGKPLMVSPVNKEVNNSELVIIFASNKGLCGSFNTNVFKATRKLVEQNQNIKYAICFGKFSEKVARKLGLEIKLSYFDIEKITSATQIFKIENFARKMFESGEVSKVHAVYTNFVKMGIFEPRAVTLYPVDKNLNTYTNDLNVINNALEGDKHDKKLADKIHEDSMEKKSAKKIYTFEPSLNILIEKSIPKLIRMILFSFILESRASENSSRSFAMKRANESAGEMLGTLKITYNKIRQDSITQEIAEISAGANAG